MSSNVIEVRDLVKKYDERDPILNGITFSVKDRGFVTVYGKSGCGKTTLLNILGGLDKPTSGGVTIDGQDITQMSEDELAHMRLEKIGFVFQDFNLLTDMTIRDNIALPLRFSRRRNEDRVDDLMKKFHIDHLADETANKTSGGEAQRAAIARALVNEPRIILADEPTGNLDSENTANVIETFKMAVNEYGTTVILATHDKELAAYSDTRIAVVDAKAILDVTN